MLQQQLKVRVKVKVTLQPTISQSVCLKDITSNPDDKYRDWLSLKRWSFLTNWHGLYPKKISSTLATVKVSDVRMRTFPTMHVFMCLQITLITEWLITHIAGIWMLPRYTSWYFSKTHFTGIHILPNIFALMCLQIILLDMEAPHYECANVQVFEKEVSKEFIYVKPFIVQKKVKMQRCCPVLN
jgi:hypothetical protein